MDNTAYFKDGYLYDAYPRNKNLSLYENRDAAYNARYIVSDEVTYDLTNYKDIIRIKTPSFLGSYDTTSSLDYILRMCASNYRNAGKNHLSVAILSVATKLMMYSNIGWSLKDFMRIVYWMIEDGRDEEAEKWEQFIKTDPVIRQKTNIKLHRSTDTYRAALSTIKQENLRQSELLYREYLHDKAEYNRMKRSSADAPITFAAFRRMKHGEQHQMYCITNNDLNILRLKFKMVPIYKEPRILIRFEEGLGLSKYCWWVLLNALTVIIEDDSSPEYYRTIEDDVKRYLISARIPKKHLDRINADIPRIIELYKGGGSS